MKSRSVIGVIPSGTQVGNLEILGAASMWGVWERAAKKALEIVKGGV